MDEVIIWGFAAIGAATLAIGTSLWLMLPYFYMLFTAGWRTIHRRYEDADGEREV